MSEIKNKNVLITGGASGIGRLMAIKCAKIGARVIIWDVNRNNGEHVVSEIKNFGGRADFCFCDVSRKDEIYEVANKVISEIGEIDILINNAGIITGKSFLDCADFEIEKTMKVNTMAHFWTIKAFLPAMKEKNSGHIVTISSAAGVIGTANMADYCASKHAVFGLDESLRFEFKKEKLNIITTVVCPSYIDTGMFHGVKMRFDFLVPLLKPEYVAKKVVKAILKNKRVLKMPWFVNIIPVCRFLPIKIYDAIANFLGLSEAMDNFNPLINSGRGKNKNRN